MQFWNQMENSNSTGAKVCCFFTTHNMQNITARCSSIHKFIILGHSGPKPVLQLCAPRGPEISVKSHRVTGDSQPDRLEHFPAPWTEGCKWMLLPYASTQRHQHHLCTSLLIFAGAQTAGPWLPQSDSVHSGLMPNRAALDSSLSPTVAASAGGGWTENSPSTISHFQCPHLLSNTTTGPATLNLETASSLLESLPSIDKIHFNRLT